MALDCTAVSNWIELQSTCAESRLNLMQVQQHFSEQFIVGYWNVFLHVVRESVIILCCLYLIL